MSLKASTFRALMIQPQMLHTFSVTIPGILESPLMVNSAEMPFETYGESSIWINGQQVILPTKKQVPGEWSCMLYESIINDIGLQINALQDMTLNPPTSGWDVLSTFLPAVTDLLGKSPKDIGPTRVLTFDVAIVMLDSATGLIPVKAVTLKDSWLKAVAPLSFDASKPDSVLQWKLTFRYQSVRKVI